VAHGRPAPMYRIEVPVHRPSEVEEAVPQEPEPAFTGVVGDGPEPFDLCRRKVDGGARPARPQLLAKVVRAPVRQNVAVAETRESEAPAFEPLVAAGPGAP